MIIIIFEYTSNMVVRIHSKYIFINPKTPNYILLKSQNAPLYTYKVAIKLVIFATNGTYIFLLGKKLN